jgi:hypothetical protein
MKTQDNGRMLFCLEVTEYLNAIYFYVVTPIGQCFNVSSGSYISVVYLLKNVSSHVYLVSIVLSQILRNIST